MGLIASSTEGIRIKTRLDENLKIPAVALIRLIKASNTSEILFSIEEEELIKDNGKNFEGIIEYVAEENKK